MEQSTLGKSYAQRLRHHLLPCGNAARAPQMEAYMKGHFPFLGIDATQRRLEFRDFIKKEGLPADWQATVDELWEMEEREFHYIGMELAERCKKQWDDTALPFFVHLVQSKPWWDTVDFIASHLVGGFLQNKPGLAKEMALQWRNGGHLWLARTAIIFQLSYKEKTDWVLMQACMAPHLHSKEFFLQKAIGWALRQYARTNPTAVLGYVSANPTMASLSKREALKHLNT